MEKTTMSIKEANRLSVMRQVDKKISSMKKAAEEMVLGMLGLKTVEIIGGRATPMGVFLVAEAKGATAPSNPCVLKTLRYQGGNILTLD